LKLLDVGCGDSPRPDAFACGDLYLGQTVQRGEGRVIHPKKLRNFVVFDAHRLPFRDGSFDVVYANHVLEHIESPVSALKEWKRVGSMRVEVIVPDGRGIEELECEAHLYTWTAKSLENLLKKVFTNVKVYNETSPILWLRAGFLPSILNFMVKRLLWRFFVFNKPHELRGVGISLQR